MTNQTILQGLKMWLDKTKGLWIDKLHSVLLAYHTTHRLSINETPFSLAYGTKAIIPLEMSLPSNRVNFDAQENSEHLHANLNLLKEDREKAHIQMAKYKQWISHHYNSKVKKKYF